MVEVFWEDSTAQKGWHDFDRDDPPEFEARTVGYVVWRDDRGIRLAFGGAETGQVDTEMTIPQSAIRSVHGLRRDDEALDVR